MPGISLPGRTRSAATAAGTPHLQRAHRVVSRRHGPGRGARRPLLPPRRAAQLGSVVAEGIQCGYHGLVIDGSGRCVRIPGQKQIPEDARVRSYPAVEKDQLVWVWMGDPAKADVATIADYPYHNDPGKWPNKHDVYPIKANYMLMVDNLMDLTHLGYLHAKTVGGNPAAHVEAEMKTARTPTGVKFTRWMKNSVPPPSYVKAAGFKGRVDRWQDFEFVAPSSVLQWTGAADAGTGDLRRQARRRLPVPAVSRPDAGDRDQLLLFLVGGQRLSAERTRSDRAALPGDRPDLCRGPGMVEAQQARLDEFGEEGLVDIASDATRMHMRRMVERLIAGERAELAAE